MYSWDARSRDTPATSEQKKTWHMIILDLQYIVIQFSETPTTRRFLYKQFRSSKNFRETQMAKEGVIAVKLTSLMQPPI